MLRITIPAEEFWDEVNEEFIYTKEQTLQLEHSLVSLSKWESKWCKATFFSEDSLPKNSREIVTAELIYYWMIAFNIPVEFQKWHLNKLLTLIRVCNVKSNPPKRRSKREIMKRNAALNAARRSRLNTRG